MSAQLILQFEGYVLIRIPTDPDPTDERRGISGYTFAFGDEPDLDRVLRLQLPPGFTPRSHCPPIGVRVKSATRLADGRANDVAALVGASVDLLDAPRFENRNWTLTLPGFEPIVPFHLQIKTDAVLIQRDDPLDPAHPDKPFWLVDAANLQRRGARGMEYEPETIGHALGLWDYLTVVQERCALLHKDRNEERDKPHPDPARLAILDGRIAQLEYALANPSDRRVGVRAFVERFAFSMAGPNPIIQGNAPIGGELDPNNPWPVSFWLGGWDPDFLCAYMQGALTIPYTSTSNG